MPKASALGVPTLVASKALVVRMATTVPILPSLVAPVFLPTPQVPKEAPVAIVPTFLTPVAKRQEVRKGAHGPATAALPGPAGAEVGGAAVPRRLHQVAHLPEVVTSVARVLGLLGVARPNVDGVQVAVVDYWRPLCVPTFLL